MMASNAPITPGVKRSFSLPPQMSSSRVASIPDPQIEILYNLPSVRIIQFNAGKAASTTVSSRPSSSSGSPMALELPGTLSWVSRIERTIAVGALRIYRAPGSVAFLNCQNALRPILPKSQAWCVDGESKFVLQIRPPQYWRIEVPNGTKEEQAGVEELKKVLDQVLRFEKTPCPFQRDFVVELPEAPQTPIKKRPWRPVAKSINDDSSEDGQSRASSTARTPIDVTPPDPEVLVVLECDQLRPSIETQDVPELISKIETLSHLEQETTSISDDSSICPEEQQAISRNESIESINEASQKHVDNLTHQPPNPPLLARSDTDSGEDIDDSFDCANSTEDAILTPKPRIQTYARPLTAESDLDKPPALQNFTRSVTAPPVLSLITSPPSKHRTKSTSPLRYSTNLESNSSNSDFSSSVESFHSVQSWHSPLAPPSPPASQPSSPADTYPYPHENILLTRRPLPLRDTSEQTVVPATPRHWDVTEDVSVAAPNTTPPLKSQAPVREDISPKSDKEAAEVVAPPVRPAIRHRATTSSNSRTRTLSPLPAAVNLFSPPRNRRRKLQTARHLPTAIIQKTCEILLSPPSHLFHLMISIASKIAAGEWRGMLSSQGEAVHWDFEDDYGGNAWFEDDYGMGPPNYQTNKARSTSLSPNVAGGSWEVD